VAEAIESSDPEATLAVDPWAEVALVAHLVDRQLEDVRSTYQAIAGSPGSDLIGLHVRRSATEVAERCARLGSMSGPDAAATQTARCLASISALAVLALRSGDATDVVVVLSDAVAERFRSTVHAATEGTSSWPPPNFSMPVELFIRQLPEHTATMETWRLATVWVAMSLKIAEAAMWWHAGSEASSHDTRSGGPG